MLMWLEKLALPKLDNKIIEEINCCKTCYEEINKSSESLFNKNQKKKEIINIAFEVFSGIFNLDYDTKIKYSKDNIDTDTIYVKSLKDDFDIVFYNLYLECFKRYLNNVYLFNEIRLDDKMYTFARMACLNKDEEMIEVLANNAYIELISSNLDVNQNLVFIDIKEEDFFKLMKEEEKRIFKLKEKVFSLNVNDQLSNFGIREVVACFSNHVFYNLDSKEKAFLCTILYNYYSDKKEDNVKKYISRIRDTYSNEVCLSMVIEDLMIPGRTMIIKKKNIDMINNVLSILPTIYSNETSKYNVGKLNSLKGIINKIKSRK